MKQHFFVITMPYRKDFITNPIEEEQQKMKEHFQYLKDLLNQDKLFLAGPTLTIEDPFGVYIFETRNEEEARELIENDPSVKAGIQKITELRPMRISLHKYQHKS
ncbi:MAG: YciI family protein [Candidatus Hodarchaeales archaeon]